MALPSDVRIAPYGGRVEVDVLQCWANWIARRKHQLRVKSATHRQMFNTQNIELLVHLFDKIQTLHNNKLLLEGLVPNLPQGFEWECDGIKPSYFYNNDYRQYVSITYQE